MVDGTVVTLKMEYGIVVFRGKMLHLDSVQWLIIAEPQLEVRQWFWYFYSRINIDENGVTNTYHKYAIWHTGTWYNGDWYGGIAYNMDFKSVTW
jgi:hypothetical protein